MRNPALLVLALAPIALAQSISGLWDATVKAGNLDIPFRFEIAGDGAAVKGSFFNGGEKLTSSSGRFENGSLTLSWDYLAGKLEAAYHDGALEGAYKRTTRTYPFTAKRAAQAGTASGFVPSIAGLWIIPTPSAKGEKAWNFIVKQKGAEVSAAILRIDGDTGALTGSYRDGKFVLSHFSGMRPSVLEVTVAADGTLNILEGGKTKLVATRASEARAKGLPEPDDPATHTRVKDPTEPFRFSFPDLNGKVVSNTDARFKGKVVLVNITGSWCPNCHDEAPFLAVLYRKHHAQGLEIVGMAFEEGDQLKDPVRLRAFIKRYGIEYPVLLCGEPDSAAGKLSQAENWNAWPTTFFIGRDGHVRGTHTGFPSDASGDLAKKAKEEFTAQVERLLNENARTSR